VSDHGKRRKIAVAIRVEGARSEELELIAIQEQLKRTTDIAERPPLGA
jgi:hypothetical protein